MIDSSRTDYAFYYHIDIVTYNLLIGSVKRTRSVKLDGHVILLT